MSLSVRHGGVWKEVVALAVRNGGAWRTVEALWVRDAGTWKTVLVGATNAPDPEPTETVTITSDQEITEDINLTASNFDTANNNEFQTDWMVEKDGTATQSFIMPAGTASVDNYSGGGFVEAGHEYRARRRYYSPGATVEFGEWTDYGPTFFA